MIGETAKTSQALARERDVGYPAQPVAAATMASAEALQRRLQRMAFDVHDGPMQDLIAIGFGLRALRATVVRSPDGDGADHLGAEFDELGVRLAETEKVLRSMMFSLEENAAARTDLLAVVAEHVETFKSHAPAAVEVIAHGDLELCTDSQRIAAERVLRESLSNIAKHAGADNVTIQLRGTRDSLLLQVRDDGRGFEPGDRRRSGTARIGLDAMRERLELIGSSLTVDSSPGGPTAITAVIEKWDPRPA
jgi:two-component system NarL family sensor kinase